MTVRKSILLSSKRRKNLKTWFKESKESFPKEIMIVADFSHNGRIYVKRVYENVNIISTFYQEHFLSNIFKYEITSLYPQFHESVELHENKESNSTSQCTFNFLEKVEQEVVIKGIAFTDIPGK
ncbi:hypothetical protein AVEN_24596-1 [Araneus ventricosus]|uniref:Uncharacterized protein n=1 Tax=Araneus ventricosus TaxID=182803 RepID=A0A4Y2FG57_ARAVE|nr:hypothetical protein AVEN_24596-1 [Araneus ventricosus]